MRLTHSRLGDILLVIGGGACAMGVGGGVTGMLAGSLAPGIPTGLYALDGPEPPRTFNPVVWGSQQGFLVGLLFGTGGSMLTLSCIYLASWRPRITIRLWMIAVAVVGLVLGGSVGGYRLKRRHDNFLALARHHAEQQSECRDAELNARVCVKEVDVSIGLRDQDQPDEVAEVNHLKTLRAYMTEQAADWMRLGSFHAAMARKYGHAARYAWLPVEPDPAQPRINFSTPAPVRHAESALGMLVPPDPPPWMANGTPAPPSRNNGAGPDREVQGRVASGEAPTVNNDP